MNKQFLITIGYLFLKVKGNIKSKKKLEIFQKKKLKKHRKFLLNNSPFYKKLLKDNDISLLDLPVINKKIWMDSFNEINTLKLDYKECSNLAINAELNRNFRTKINGTTVGLSSGTSGFRGVFLVSEKEEIIWASNMLYKLLPNLLFEKKQIKVAFFLRANSNLYESVDSKKIFFNYFDMMNCIDKNIKQLDILKPDVLIAPPSMLRELANNIDNFDTSKIKKIVSVAEVLDSLDESILIKSFKVSHIHQVYQCTEGFLAATCKYGNLHLNEENIVIQKKWIDDERFIPIVTDFTRTSQPIVRYEMTDILKASKNQICECKSASFIIDKIEGRTDDILEIMDGDKIIKIYPDFLTRAIIYCNLQINNYQVQILENKLNIIIDTNIKFDKEIIITSLNNMLNNFDVQNYPISVEFKNLKPIGINKFKHVIKL